MAKKVCIQAGHLNCQNNSIVSLRTATGAPGEMAFNQDMVNRVANIFKKIPDITITKTDANANDNSSITGKDFDLFLSVHYDADIYNDTGGFIDSPDPSIDLASAESQRIAGVMGGVYFSRSGIKQVQKRSNANTKFYYMWQYLTAKTPCVLLECGVGWRKPNDFEALNTDSGRAKIATVIAEAICKSFGVSFPEEDGGNVSEEIMQKAGYYAEVRKLIGVTQDKYSAVIERLQELLGKEKDYNNRLEQVKRLEGQISLLNDQIKVLSDGTDKTIQALNENILKLHATIDQLGRDKGGLNDQITELKVQLKTCQDTTPVTDRNCIEKLIKLLFAGK